MAVGKISYNGGSGVKGAAEATYTIHADSEEIKAGNFVELKNEYSPQEGASSTTVLTSKTIFTPFSLAMGNNKVLVAYGTLDVSFLRLYDVTEGANPVLLDEVEFNHGAAVYNLYMYKYDDNRAIVCYESYDDLIEYIFVVSTENDELTVGDRIAGAGRVSNSMIMERFSNNKLVHFVCDNFKIVQSTYSVNGLTLVVEKEATRLNDIYIELDSPMILKSIGNNKAIFVYEEWGENTTGYYRNSFCVVQLNSNGSVTFGSIYDIDTDGSIPFDGVLVSENKLMLVLEYEDNLTGYILTINTSNNTISVSNPSILKTGVNVNSVKIAENKVGEYVVVYGGKASSLSVNVENNTVSVGTESTITTSAVDVSLSVPISNRVMVFYKNANSYLALNQFSIKDNLVSNAVTYYQLVPRVTKATSKIDGVAKKSGVAGDEIVIYTLGGNA